MILKYHILKIVTFNIKLIGLTFDKTDDFTCHNYAERVAIYMYIRAETLMGEYTVKIPVKIRNTGIPAVT